MPSPENGSKTDAPVIKEAKTLEQLDMSSKNFMASIDDLNNSYKIFIAGIRNTVIAGVLTAGVFFTIDSSKNEKTQHALGGVFFLGTIATLLAGYDANNRLGDYREKQLALTEAIIKNREQGKSITEQ